MFLNFLFNQISQWIFVVLLIKILTLGNYFHFKYSSLMLYFKPNLCKLMIIKK